jgi:hypothetical protein
MTISLDARKKLEALWSKPIEAPKILVPTVAPLAVPVQPLTDNKSFQAIVAGAKDANAQLQALETTLAHLQSAAECIYRPEHIKRHTGQHRQGTG